MKIKSFLTAALGALSITGVSAGDWCPPDAKTPICSKNPVEDCFNGAASVGYHSDYIFRGLQLADESWTVDAHYTIPTSYGNFTFAVERIQSTIDGFDTGLFRNGDFERTNLSVSYGREIKGFDVELAYTHRDNYGPLVGPGGGIFFAQTGESEYDTNEISLAVTRCFLGGCATYTAVYDAGGQVEFIPSGWYHNLAWNREIEVNDCVTLVFNTGISYYDQSLGDDFAGFGWSGLRGFSHRQTVLSVPVKLNCRFTVTPYLGYIDTLQGGPTHQNHDHIPGLGLMRGSFNNNPRFFGFDTNSPDDKFFGGVSASLAF